MTDKEFLQWIYDRLEFVHGEKQNVDYMLKLKSIIESKTVVPNSWISLMEQYTGNAAYATDENGKSRKKAFILTLKMVDLNKEKLKCTGKSKL
jgi:hypothetical protein